MEKYVIVAIVSIYEAVLSPTAEPFNNFENSFFILVVAKAVMLLLEPSRNILPLSRGTTIGCIFLTDDPTLFHALFLELCSSVLDGLLETRASLRTGLSDF